MRFGRRGSRLGGWAAKTIPRLRSGSNNLLLALLESVVKKSHPEVHDFLVRPAKLDGHFLKSHLLCETLEVLSFFFGELHFSMCFLRVSALINLDELVPVDITPGFVILVDDLLGVGNVAPAHHLNPTFVAELIPVSHSEDEYRSRNLGRCDL
jgi:hypothetical protein